MNTILNWKNFENKFGGWSRYIKPFFDEGGFDDIYIKLKKEGRDGEIITPLSENTFKFLEKTSPEKLKVIFIGMDSYPGRYKNGQFQATGIAFDCSNSPDGKLQPSLISFFEGMEKDLKTKVKRVPDLTYLCEQGVLLGNRALTCRLNQTSSHIGMWDPFWQYFLAEVVTAYFTGVPVVLIGDSAHFLKRYVFPIANPIFEISHPSSAARNEIIWDSQGVFASVNKILKENNNFEIFWDYEDWDLPF
jgi:uracil DNA glycosylase